MAQRPHVPKFGNWESEENVPYTVYFDKARKGKSGGKMINPNDPQENPDMFPIASPSRTRPAPEEPAGRGSVKPTHDPRVSREDGGLRQVTDAPARNDNIARKTESSLTHQRQGGRGSSSGRPARQSAGSEYSIERSPLNPHARGMGRGGGSPAPEGKINSYDSSHGTPGRSRLRPARSESPDRGAAVPKFGDWDEKNPQSAETYTDIFNRVREERQTGGSANVPGTPRSPYNTTRKGKNVEGQSSTRCCFL